MFAPEDDARTPQSHALSATWTARADPHARAGDRTPSARRRSRTLRSHVHRDRRACRASLLGAAPRLSARAGARTRRPPHAALARRARASIPRRALVVAAAESDDVEPAPRDYTGELRMPPVEQTPEVLPAMLFPADEVLLPGSTQVLHLYEARFLALLDEVTDRTGGLFAHVTFLPPSPGAPIDEGLRVNQVATLVRVEEVQREEVGAKVTVIGESRLQLVEVRDSDPYVRARFLTVPTMGAEGTLAYTPSEEEMAEVEALTEFIDTAVNDVVALVDRLARLGEDGEDPESLWDISGAVDDVEWGHAEVGNLRRAMAWVEGPSITLDDLDGPASRRMRLTGSRRCWRSGWRIRSCNWLSG